MLKSGFKLDVKGRIYLPPLKHDSSSWSKFSPSSSLLNWTNCLISGRNGKVDILAKYIVWWITKPNTCGLPNFMSVECNLTFLWFRAVGIFWWWQLRLISGPAFPSCAHISFLCTCSSFVQNYMFPSFYLEVISSAKSLILSLESLQI